MKKIPLKAYALLTIAFILFVCSVTFVVKAASNHAFIKEYEKGNYDEKKENGLLFINVPESYLPYYNLGNVAFEKEDYNSAIGYYTKALSLFPLGKKDCMVRINLALAMCYSIDFENLDTQDEKDTALVILYRARDILLLNGCAKDDPEVGHNKDAQQLKEDIDRMIELLTQENDSQNDQQEDQEQEQQKDENDSDEKDNGSSAMEKKKQDELNGDKKNALEERRSTQDSYEKWGRTPGKEGDGAQSGVGGIGGDSGISHPW